MSINLKQIMGNVYVIKTLFSIYEYVNLITLVTVVIKHIYIHYSFRYD